MNLRFLGWISVGMMGSFKRGKRRGGKLKNSAMDVFNLEAHEMPK